MDSQRRSYLADEVQALQTRLRLLRGESLNLVEEVEGVRVAQQSLSAIVGEDPSGNLNLQTNRPHESPFILSVSTWI